MLTGAAAAGLQVGKRGADATTAEQAKRPRSKGSKKGGKGNMDDLVMAVAKFSVVNSRAISVLQAASLTVILFEKETPVGKVVHTQTKEAARQYTSTIAGKSPTEKASYISPHIFVWLGLVASLVTMLEEKKETYPYKQQIEKLQQFTDEYTLVAKEMQKEFVVAEQVAMRMALAERIRTCRLSKCYNAALIKVELSGLGDKAQEAAKAVAAILCLEAKGQRKHGQAPRSDNERRVIQHLDNRSED
eukprot:TRINITY_DN12358_c0_g1_i6.p2 TRINITY_DN12358_c0_g1~~TRINITY_DN12358_c0_g1_i6.p2  ORF type:complete len:246 (-),score=82.26 TRINITY_DN12358_c0_g1_i6:841-1578(-)